MIGLLGRRRGQCGMVLGKFLPPHRGHLYLIDFARRFVDDVTVVVGTLAAEPIPGELRYRWMRRLFPDLNVVHLTDENPQAPEEHPVFWRIWRESLERVLPKRPDWIFASEAYGARLAEELGATFVPVDPARSVVPVSGTAIRRDPLANWRFLPPCVRPYFAKRVVVFGPESCGKSTLAARLAAHYQTAVVPEYARTLLEAQGGRVERRDLERIARGQIASEEVLAEECQRLLICDTDPLTTHIWSEALYGGCEPWLAEEAARRRYDLHLLLDVDVPFVPDPVRYLPGQREAFFERCRAALESSGRPFVRVRGGWEQRFATAVDAIDRLLQPL